ncbi:pyruvate formate lyase activating enzyme [Streptomyces sp. TLI_053]|uniref:pyruvate formate-lyase-activating protein n=1 Tax=Streptomyces sp. TLI_053 TaxID=1855352 RepID=UPI00087CA703|nr:pyruvate formate-lyase-activating protein [Streptomyces sp. TLI_053]SDT82711.1 pyruvate formate lyase activating enzyme [Streptomyces sp. TLI_053]
MADDPTTPAPAAGMLHSWDVSTCVDGPGTRFVAFLAGCPLRCLYCHNPDTRYLRDGHPVIVDEIVREAAGSRGFLHASGGRATVSGGEPLLQPALTGELLHRLKHELGLHATLDTSGYLGARATDALLSDTDLVLLDIKSWDRALQRRVTGREPAPTLEFAYRLAAVGTEVRVRFVHVPGLTDPAENIEGVAALSASLGNVTWVDVLPFRRLGAAKWRARGLDFPLADTPVPTSGQLTAARAVFSAHGLYAV